MVEEVQTQLGILNVRFSYPRRNGFPANVLIRPEDIIHDDTSPFKAQIMIKNFLEQTYFTLCSFKTKSGYWHWYQATITIQSARISAYGVSLIFVSRLNIGFWRMFKIDKRKHGSMIEGSASLISKANRMPE
jgi:hypothetical protein